MSQAKVACMNRLKELRTDLGLSQEGFAKKVKISRASLSYYENGVRTMDIEVLDSICTAVGCSPDYLLGRTNNKNPNSSGMDTLLGLSGQALEKLQEHRYIGHLLSFLADQEDFEAFAYHAASAVLEEFDDYERLYSCSDQNCDTCASPCGSSKRSKKLYGRDKEELLRAVAASELQSMLKVSALKYEGHREELSNLKETFLQVEDD